MNQDTKKKILAGAAEKTGGRTTFHAKDGRFANQAGAATATRNGERLKVVRQLRRMSRAPKAEGRDEGMRTVLRSNLAKTKAALTGALSGPGWINVEDAIFKD